MIKFQFLDFESYLVFDACYLVFNEQVILQIHVLKHKSCLPNQKPQVWICYRE